MPTFEVNGHSFTAENCVDGLLVNPILPKMFDQTPNEDRPPTHAKWWNFPFIETLTVEEVDAFYAETYEYMRKHWAEGRQNWIAAWPTGTRYDTRCLDGRLSCCASTWGMFATLEEAVACKSPVQFF
jgi:hypothetical protein